MSLLQRSLAARRWDGVAVCLLYGALILRFEATRPVTGPVWRPGHFLTDLPDGFIVIVYPDGTAVPCDEALPRQVVATEQPGQLSGHR